MSEQWPLFADALRLDGVLCALSDADLKADLARLAVIYDERKPDRCPVRGSPTIPKLIHQIWLGGSLPRKLAEYSESWRAGHPGWELRLWTDTDVAQLDFPSRDLFEDSTCWGQKSDLLRVEILESIGGVYVDLDYQCYASLDPLVDRYDFFGTLRNIFTAYLGWPDVWRTPIVACNSLFGARPGHPILRAYLEAVRDIWRRRDVYELHDGELPKMAIAAMGGFAKAKRIKDTGTRTYLPFSDVVMAHLDEPPNADIVFPPVFFNPLMAGARMLYLMPDFWQRCRAAGIKWPDIRPYNRRAPYSIGNHLSNNSWV